MLKSASEPDYPPFCIVRVDGSACGFSVELLKAAVEAVGMEVEIPIAPWHTIKQQLIDKELEVLPLVSYSKERDEYFDFTAPYLRMGGTIFVRKGEFSIRDKKDLKDKEVLVMRGDTAHEYALRENLSDHLILTDTFEDALKILSSGKHDAVIIQKLVGHQLIKKLEISNLVNVSHIVQSNFKPVATPLAGFEQKFCFAVQEGDAALLSQLNEGLAIVFADGTYEQLYKQWFQPILPGPTVSWITIIKVSLAILGPILFLFALVCLWYLRREVRKKTQSLKLEIKERAAVELELLTKNRALLVLTEFNKALAKTKDETELLEKACQILIDAGRYRLVWIGFTEDTIEKTIKVMAQRGFDDDYLKTANIRWDDSEYGKGPTGQSIRTQSPVVAQDILTNNSLRPWKAAAVKRGYQSSIALPLCEGDRCFGSVNIYSSQPESFSDIEVELLQEFTSDLVFGLKTIRMEASHQKAMQDKKDLGEKLTQAHKMEAIGTLAGGIAHDFNNILSVILGYADMIKEDLPPGERSQDDIEKVLTAANRAKDLVKQILAFSRQAEVERFPIQIQLLVKEGLKMLRSSIPSTISITEDIDLQCETIFADPTHIHQILMNLCTNAYHSMERSGGILSVTLKPISIDPDNQPSKSPLSPGEYVELTVGDTGSGIGPDILHKIFDPYFTTKEIGKGTGMGLAIIHGIMSDCGGDITVESQLGKGSTFHVYFPVMKREALPEIKESADIPKGKERILFVDDEELLAEMGENMLKRLGYHVTVRCSSFEALETFRNTPNEFDVVITDQTMPGMTGSDLSRRMMQIRPDIPIILCTGYSNLIDENSVKLLGIREFALKPLTKRVIAKLLRKVLDENTHLNGKQ